MGFVVVVDWKKYAFVIALALQYASTELSLHRRFSEREPDGTKNLFKLFVLFLKEADHIGGTTPAIERIHGNYCIRFRLTDSQWAA